MTRRHKAGLPLVLNFQAAAQRELRKRRRARESGRRSSFTLLRRTSNCQRTRSSLRSRLGERGTPRLTADQVVAVLRRNGFTLAATAGSHQKWRKVAIGKQVIVPYHRGRVLPLGTMRSIIEGSGMSRKPGFYDPAAIGTRLAFSFRNALSRRHPSDRLCRIRTV